MVHTKDGAVAIIYTSKWSGDSKESFGTNPRSKCVRPVVKKNSSFRLREALVRPTKDLVAGGWRTAFQLPAELRGKEVTVN